MPEKQLLVVAHVPSANTLRLAEAVLRGARNPEIDGVAVRHLPPLEAGPADVLGADALVLGTTENLGYMSGALKDFFDRIYYPCLDQTRGLPYALYVRAGHDGTGTRRAVREPLLCRGEWQDTFLDDCEELGTLVAAGLEAGIF